MESLPRDLWTLDVDKIQFEDVVAFCNRQVHEGWRCDYKEEFSSNSPGKQISTAVCAFANTQGGLLIYGVAEKDRLPEMNPQGRDIPAAGRDIVIQACVDHISPTPLFYVSNVLCNPADSCKRFLVIRVPASLDGPHAIESDTGVFVRVREHDKSFPKRATVTQITALIDRRRTAEALQTERVNRSIQRLKSALPSLRSTTPAPSYIAVSIGPAIGGPDQIDVSEFIRKPPLKARLIPGVETVADGVYSTNYDDTTGWMIDAHGIATVLHSDKKLSMRVKKWHSLSLRPGDWLADHIGQDASFIGLHLVFLFLPFLNCRKATLSILEKSNFFGMLRIRTVVIGAVLRSIIVRNDGIIAANRTGGPLELVMDADAPTFRSDEKSIGARYADSLIRAWGKLGDLDGAAYYDQALEDRKKLVSEE